MTCGREVPTVKPRPNSQGAGKHGVLLSPAGPAGPAGPARVAICDVKPCAMRSDIVTWSAPHSSTHIVSTTSPQDPLPHKAIHRRILSQHNLSVLRTSHPLLSLSTLFLSVLGSDPVLHITLGPHLGCPTPPLIGASPSRDQSRAPHM